MLFDIPKIATSGGLMIGVKYFPPIPPKLEIVKVPPERSLGLRAFDLALSLTSDNSLDKSEIVFNEDKVGVINWCSHLTREDGKAFLEGFAKASKNRKKK